MRRIRSLLVLGLLGVLTAACGENITDVCGIDTRCAGEKLTYRIYLQAESYRTGEGVEKDPTKAAVWYGRAVERGSDAAQIRLGNSYMKGNGVAKDPAKAVQLYRMAAETGNPWAQMSLATSYMNGEGIEKDPAKAVQLYRMAAETGNAWAQMSLANS